MEFQTGFEILTQMFGTDLEGYVIVSIFLLGPGIAFVAIGFIDARRNGIEQTSVFDFLGLVGLFAGAFMLSIGHYPEIQEFFQSLKSVS